MPEFGSMGGATLNKVGIDVVVSNQDAIAKLKATQKEVNKLSTNTKGMSSQNKKSTTSIADFAKGLGGLNINSALAAAGVLGVVKAGEQLYSLGRQGAAANQLAESFSYVTEQAGLTTAYLDELSAAANNTVDQTTLMSSTMMLVAGTSGALQAELLGLAPQFVEIAKAAQKVNPQLGTTEFLVNSLFTATKRRSTLIADNLGLSIRAGEANKAYAASIGKTVEQLTEQEKTLAFAYAAIEQGDNIIAQAGGTIEATTDGYDQFTASLKNAKDALLGLIATPVGQFFGTLAGFVNSIFDPQQTNNYQSALEAVQAERQSNVSLYKLALEDMDAYEKEKAKRDDALFEKAAGLYVENMYGYAEGSRKYNNMFQDIMEAYKDPELYGLGDSQAVEAIKKTLQAPALEPMPFLRKTENDLQVLADKQVLLAANTAQAEKDIESWAKAVLTADVNAKDFIYALSEMESQSESNYKYFEDTENQLAITNDAYKSGAINLDEYTYASARAQQGMMSLTEAQNLFIMTDIAGKKEEMAELADTIGDIEQQIRENRVNTIQQAADNGYQGSWQTKKDIFGALGENTNISTDVMKEWGIDTWQLNQKDFAYERSKNFFTNYNWGPDLENQVAQSFHDAVVNAGSTATEMEIIASMKLTGPDGEPFDMSTILAGNEDLFEEDASLFPALAMAKEDYDLLFEAVTGGEAFIAASLTNISNSTEDNMSKSSVSFNNATLAALTLQREIMTLAAMAGQPINFAVNIKKNNIGGSTITPHIEDIANTVQNTQSTYGGIPYDVMQKIKQNATGGAYGLNTRVTKPTYFLAGENGTEDISITPQGKSQGVGGIENERTLGILTEILVALEEQPDKLAAAVLTEIQ